MRLPPNWCAVPLREVGVWRGGGTPNKQREEYWTNGTIPWVSPKDMKVEVVRTTDDHITQSAVQESATSVAPSGSTLVVVRSGILKHTLPVALAAVDVALNQDIKAVTTWEGIDGRYVAWALRGFEREILHTCSKAGTTVQSIEFPRFMAFAIPLPPTAEQRRIVAAVEEDFSDLDAAIAALERVRIAFPRYRAAVLKAACEGRLVKTEVPHSDWRLVTVEDVATDVSYGTSVRASENDNGVPVLRMGNIVDGELRLHSLKFLPKAHDEFPELLLEPGDVLFNRTNSPELVGKTAVYRGTPTPCSFASYLIRVRLAEICLPDFLSCYLNSALGRAWVRSVVSQQVGQANVSGGKLKRFRFALPPVPDQARIVAEVDRRLSLSDAAERTVEATLIKARRLRQAILKRAFQGKLVPQDPKEEPASVLLERVMATRKVRVSRT